jgi:hypothetical protein
MYTEVMPFLKPAKDPVRPTDRGKYTIAISRFAFIRGLPKEIMDKSVNDGGKQPKEWAALADIRDMVGSCSDDLAKIVNKWCAALRSLFNT